MFFSVSHGELLACDSIRQKIGFSLLYELKELSPEQGLNCSSRKSSGPKVWMYRGRRYTGN